VKGIIGAYDELDSIIGMVRNIQGSKEITEYGSRCMVWGRGECWR